MSNKVIYIVAALVALSAGLLTQINRNSPGLSVAQQKQDLLADFSLPDLQNTVHAISEWQDTVLVINFWATWCAPCRDEIPQFVRLQTVYAASGVQFIGIAIDAPDAVSDFLQLLPVNYPMLVAGEAGIELSHRLGNVLNTVPFTLIVNRNKEIILRQAGELPEDTFTSVVTPLLTH